jgi:hypothetical protein
MIDLKTKQETLDLSIRFDGASWLPLLEEQKKILFLILTYLPLPYTIAEYGCGKKSSIILRKLLNLGIPAYALKRGMIMERDLSEAMLQEKNYRNRPHALVVENPLYHPKDFHQEALLKMLEKKCVHVKFNDSEIHAGQFVLHHSKEVQFKQARSHIFITLTFWDETANEPAELVIDPTVNPHALFPVEELREKLHDEEALIFTAPPTGRLRLDEKYLTQLQTNHLQEIRSSLNGQSDDYATVIRRLTGAPEGSIGDPETWTYANNLVPDSGHDRRQKELTGNGDVIREILAEMLSARQHLYGEVVQLRDKLNDLTTSLHIHEIAGKDADWSEKQLEPLAEVENTIANYRAIRQLAAWHQNGTSLQKVLTEKDSLKKVAGIAMRLRQRIEQLAEVSENEQGEIDARALNGRFFQATLNAIRQMNQAGLTVCLDKAGNLHGLLMPPTETNGKHSRSFKHQLKNTICTCSHLDTVIGAGKYDGRLGVLSGIEVAHVLNDLQDYFNVQIFRHSTSGLSPTLLISAFIGEEMTFTGEGVSMPGSAAVSGRNSVDEIHRMTNGEGEVFRDRLVEMLEFLKQSQSDGAISLANDLTVVDSPDALLAACHEPTDFFTLHTYERHIEQGPILDRKQIPLAIVDTVMGIHQEDFFIEGIRSEQAALEIVGRLRDLALEAGEDIRITTGIIDGTAEYRFSEEVDFGLRCHLFGEKNHAGATLLEDRRDPAVGAARLALYFLEIVEELNRKEDSALIPLVGDIELFPGANRNVIPESAALTLALKNKNVSDRVRQYIQLTLQALLINKLSGPVKEGGEGIPVCNIEPIQFISPYSRTRLSIDLRTASQTATNDFLKNVRQVTRQAAETHGLKITSSIEQQLPPQQLSESGQVLQLERSYGGSHNPNEAQLEIDLLRGTLLQLEVVRHFFQLENLDGFNLFDFVKKRIPEAWQNVVQPFISGALHDTCNIAERVLEGERVRR